MLNIGLSFIDEDHGFYPVENIADNNLTNCAIEYVMANCVYDISLEKMANDLNISKYYLSHIFSDLIGINFKTYLNGLRLSVTKRLLIQTDMSVSEIAKQAGFNSVRTMDREFVKYFEESPTEFRKRFVNKYYVDVSSPESFCKEYYKDKIIEN